MLIRHYLPGDLPAIYEINCASTPGVGEETPQSLEKWILLSTCLVAADEADAPLGFINLIPPGTLAYDSANLRWIEAYYATAGAEVIYVDRIAVAQSARGQGIGEALYRAAFERYAPQAHKICCEVNSLPPNPGSLRFHKRLGFHQIGARSYAEGEKAVIYLERPL